MSFYTLTGITPWYNIEKNGKRRIFGVIRQISFW